MVLGMRWTALGMGALCMALAACAPAPQKASATAKEDPLLYPGPPDEPRFAFERVIMNSIHVTGVEESSMLKYALTGVASSGGDGLGKPYAIAVHMGRLFVSDTVDRSIKVFDIPEKRYFVIKDVPGGELGKPLGIDVDGKGNLFVADSSNRVIHVFNRDGKHLRQITDGKQFDRLSSVTVNKEGTRVYAVDIGGVQSENHRVRVYNALSGEHVMDIGKRGTEKGEFNLPRDLAIGKDDRLYVVDGGNFRVQIFDRDGKFMSTFGKVGKQLGDFARPKEIAVDPEGNVYVADAAFGNFQIFSADGEMLMFAGARSEVNGPARYMLPAGIYVDEDGRIYMGDQWFKKVDIFRPVKVPAGEGHLYTGLVQQKTGTPAPVPLSTPK